MLQVIMIKGDQKKMSLFFQWSVKWSSVNILQNGQKFWNQELYSFPKWYDT